MKRFALLLMLTAVTAFGIRAQRLLPPTVQQFLDEQAYSERYKTMLSANGVRSLFVPPHMVDGDLMVDAFIAINGEHALPLLEKSGVVINSLFDGFVTAQVPVDRLAKVSSLPGVTDVEISHRLDLCTDSTLSVTHVSQVLNGTSYGLPQAYDGSGVIIGVIDVGFDYQHRAFRSDDNPAHTRIVRVYSTTNRNGHTAHYNKNIRLPGSVFMGNEIYSLTTDNTSSTHGTHTAGIAAGSHVNGYGGMAPGADIVLCAVSVLDGSMSAVEVANCVRYIDAYADSVGQPCVMSLSVSTPNGQHDGNDYLSRVVKQIMGPGRLFVISAGNDAGRKSYAHKAASKFSPLSLLFKCSNSLGGDSSYYYGGLLTDLWMRQETTNFYYKFHVLDQTDGKIVWESEEYSKKVKIDASELTGFYRCYTNADTAGYIQTNMSYTSDGKKYRLEVSIHNLISVSYTYVNGVRKSRYALGLTMYPRKDITTDIDAWACNSGVRFGTYNNPITLLDGSVVSGYYAGASDSCCIGSYAVGDSTISAGAYAARNNYYSMTQHGVITDYSITVGDIASFSSYEVEGAGPSGKALPTICAPGINVAAAVSRYSYFARNSIYTVMATSDGSYWGVMSGTSMAAPTVAGIIALWLQANPNLTVAQVKDIIAQTAIKDRFTQGSKRDHFGPNGKIDAMEGLRLVLDKIEPELPQKGDVNCDGIINIVDVTMLIQYIITEKQPTEFSSYAADLNEDGRITVSDLSTLITIAIAL